MASRIAGSAGESSFRFAKGSESGRPGSVHVEIERMGEVK